MDDQLNFIDYIEDGVNFVIPEFILMVGETSEDFAIRERESIVKAISVAITQMVELNLSQAPTFSVSDQFEDTVFALSREDAKTTIDVCIEYFSEVEEYEKCAKLLNLKSKL